MFLPLFLSVLLCKRSAVRLSRRRVRLLCLCTQFNHIRITEYLTRRLLADVLLQRVKRARQGLDVYCVRIFPHTCQQADLLTLSKVLRTDIADVNPILCKRWCRRPHNQRNGDLPRGIVKYGCK